MTLLKGKYSKRGTTVMTSADLSSLHNHKSTVTRVEQKEKKKRIINSKWELNGMTSKRDRVIKGHFFSNQYELAHWAGPNKSKN